MKIGDLVQSQGYDTVKGRIGIVMRIDKDHYGNRQAFKMSPRQRDECVNPASPNIVKRIELGRTAICDRVLVMFRDGVTPEYFRSTEFKVVSEG
jgi:hypothetical protein